MEFRCFNGMNNCDYCGSCHSEFKARTSDEKRRIYNQALEDLFNKCKELSYKESLETDSSVEFTIIELDDIEKAVEQLKK